MATAFLDGLETVLTDGEKAIVKRLSSELGFLLCEFEVPLRVQLRRADLGYTSLTTFSVMADDRPGLRAAIAADIIGDMAGANAGHVAKARTITTGLLAAWLASAQRTTDQIRMAADNKMLRLPGVLTKPNVIALRAKYETEFGRVSDSLWPCTSLLEKRMEEVEEGSFTAQPLSEIISVDRAEDEMVTIAELGTGVRVRKAPKLIPLPHTTEELRNRFITLGITFVLASYKHSSRLWIKSATAAMWGKYVGYLLSDEVALFHLDQESLSVKASWATVLGYDLAMRKLATRRVLYESEDMATALDYAMKDLNCKERFFITPTAILAAAAPRGKVLETPEAPGVLSNNQKRKLERANWLASQKASKVHPPPESKGKGKGKGKEKGKKTKFKLVKTPDGRFVCGFYQLPSGCTKESCTFVHVCSRCFENHPESQCTVPAP